MTDYNALWVVIQANEDCAPHIVPSTPKVAASIAAAGDQAIADILNAAGYGASTRAVPAWQAKKLLIKRGKWRAIVLASENAAHPEVEAAYAAVALAEDARLDADFCDPSAGPLLAALVASNLISATDRADLEAMCRFSGGLTAADVSRAVRGPRE